MSTGAPKPLAEIIAEASDMSEVEQAYTRLVATKEAARRLPCIRHDDRPWAAHVAGVGLLCAECLEDWKLENLLKEEDTNG